MQHRHHPRRGRGRRPRRGRAHRQRRLRAASPTRRWRRSSPTPGCPWILMHWRGHSVDDGRARALRRRGRRRSSRADGQGGGGRRRRRVRGPRSCSTLASGSRRTPSTTGRCCARCRRSPGATGPGWGFPVLIGASRKRFLGALLADAHGPRPAAGREAATTAISALAAAAGVWGVRVHEVSASLDAVRVALATTGRGAERDHLHGVVTSWLTGSRSPACACSGTTGSSTTRSGDGQDIRRGHHALARSHGRRPGVTT